MSLQQAVESAPTLARLTELVRDSSARLAAVQALIPASLRPFIQAGAIDGDTWCLLVASTAAAAKLRQLLPSLQAHLKNQGWEINSIRLKVQTRRSM